MSLEQWVNLDKSDIHTKDGDGLTHERCGKVTIEATFEKSDQPIMFKVKLTPDSNNARYTKKEKRNGNFKLIQTRLGVSDKKSVLIEESIQLPASGGDKYKIEAMDSKGNKVVGDMEIETRRKLYYEIITMQGLTIPNSFSDFEKEFWSSNKNYYIKLKNIGQSTIPMMHNIGNTTDTDTLVKNAKAVYKGKKYDKGKNGSHDTNVIAVLFTSHLAVKELSPELSFSVPAAALTGQDIPVEIKYASPGQGVNLHPLWRKIIPGDDAWFVSAEFEDHLGNTHTLNYSTHVTEGPIDIGSDGISTIIFKPSCFPQSFTSNPSNTGKLTFQINAVNRMRAGLALGDNNSIVICTKAWWRNTNSKSMIDTMIHELGHKIGMVPTGKNNELGEQKKTLYTGKGHRGPHCSSGYKYVNTSGNNWEWVSDPSKGVKCVMFGQTNGKSEFCPECAESVRRVDCDVKWASLTDI